MRAPDPTRDDFRYWIVEHIRFADLDMLGHVNNKSFLTYAESVRAAFLQETGVWVPHAAQQNVLANLSIAYRSELHYPGKVDAGLRVETIGRSSFGLALGLFNGHACAASLQVTMVRIDAATRKPVPIDDGLRAILESYRLPSAR